MEAILLQNPAVYCRVSSHEQKAKGDLDRQVDVAVTHCTMAGLGTPAVFTDVASGLNASRPGLARLCKAIEHGQVGRVIVTYRDRLTRFGFGYLKRYFASHGASIDVLKQAMQRSMHDELVDDLVAIVTSFSGRVHGMRGRRPGKKQVSVTWREIDDAAFDEAVRDACTRAWQAATRNSVHRHP